MKKRKVSIATGCYNSEKFIERTYRSIAAQSYRDMEWQVVVDGDTDLTRSILETLQAAASFPIHITTFEVNRGPEVSVGTAVHNCTGDFTLILDHDDELMPDALAELLAAWDAVSLAVDTTDISAVWGRCVNERDELIGGVSPELLVAGHGHYFHIEKIRGESAVPLFRTDILKEFYRFTAADAGSSNGLAWNRMGRHYKAIFTNRVVRRYHTDVPSAYSKSRAIKAPRAAASQSLEYLNDNAKYFASDPWTFLRQIVMYERYSIHAKRGLLRPIRALVDGRMRLAAACVSPVALWTVARDKQSGRVP